MYVADLPPEYNLHIIANEGCEEGRILKEMLANPLGPLFESSLDKALYRWAQCLQKVVVAERLECPDVNLHFLQGPYRLQR